MSIAKRFSDEIRTTPWPIKGIYSRRSLTCLLNSRGQTNQKNKRIRITFL